MRTVRSSSRPGGSPPGTPRSRHPLGQGTPLPGPGPPKQAPCGTRHPQTRSPSTSPLAVGLDQIPLNFPLGCGPGPDPPPLPPWVWAWRTPPWRPAGIPPAMHAGIPPPETYCKTCWDTTCNACWDSTPHVDRHTPVNLLPCPKLRLRAVITMIKELH